MQKFKYFNIIFLIINILFLSLNIMIKNDYFKNKEFPIVKIKEPIKKNQFALMLEKNKGSGDYEESDGELPTEGYVFNKEKSKCADINGGIIDGILNYDYETYKITLNTSKTSYCYLYYDIEPNIEYLRSKDTENHITKDLTGGMYRYQGLSTEDVRNYICLGENCCNTEECSADTNDSMYRIIGITPLGELKVIKKTALTEAMQWGLNNSEDIKWPQSVIYSKLNVINEEDTNSYYYNLDNNLKKLIINSRQWLYGDAINNTKYDGNIAYSYEKGIDESLHYVKNGENYLQESYKWNEYVEAPIGLIYIHDYLYAYPGGNPNTMENASKSWINLYSNELNHPANTSVNNFGMEYTITKYGLNLSNYYQAIAINIDGKLQLSSQHLLFAIRPVFYLTSDIELTGDGTLSNPFRIF